MKEDKEPMVDVVCLVRVKHEGTLRPAGTALRIPRAEFLGSPAGTFRPADQPTVDPVLKDAADKQKRDDERRAQKTRLLEQERILREEAAARELALIEDRRRSAEAAVARRSQQRKSA